MAFNLSGSGRSGKGWKRSSETQLNQSSKLRLSQVIARARGPKLEMFVSVALWCAMTCFAKRAALPADVWASETNTTGSPRARARRVVVSTQNSVCIPIQLIFQYHEPGGSSPISSSWSWPKTTSRSGFRPGRPTLALTYPPWRLKSTQAGLDRSNPEVHQKIRIPHNFNALHCQGLARRRSAAKARMNSLAFSGRHINQAL